MNKTNTQLPRVELPEPQKVNWFSTYHLWGYAFLGLTFLLIVGFIYQMEYGNKAQESRICIQVVTTARSPYSGETKEYPTPCDVPEGWEIVPGVYNEIPDLNVEGNGGEGSRLVNPNDPDHVSFQISSECNLDNCVLLENRGGKTNEFISLLGQPSSVHNSTNVGMNFEVIGWNDNVVVVQGYEQSTCEKPVYLYQISLNSKKTILLDEAFPGVNCTETLESQQDYKDFNVKLEDVRKDLIDPRLI